jgi:hypothetical protein
MKRKTRLLTVTAVASVLALAPQAAFASGGGSLFWNDATTFTAGNNGRQFRLAFDIDQTGAPAVNAINHANAFSYNCFNCRTTSIAFQIIVTRSNPVAINIDNAALAVSKRCIYCATLATAYEFVLEQNGPAQLSSSTRQQLQQIRDQLSDLRRSGLSGSGLQAAVDNLAGQVQAVLLATQQTPPNMALRAPQALAAPGNAAPAATPPAQVLVYRQSNSQ